MTPQEEWDGRVLPRELYVCMREQSPEAWGRLLTLIEEHRNALDQACRSRSWATLNILPPGVRYIHIHGRPGQESTIQYDVPQEHLEISFSGDIPLPGAFKDALRRMFEHRAT